MKYIIFILLFFCMANRHIAATVVEKLKGLKKLRGIRATDKRVLAPIEAKTGLKLPYYLLYETDTFFGMMGGVPTKPMMFISTYALNNFDKDELEWLLLHEAGHYLLFHVLKEAAFQFSLACMGVFILSKTTDSSSIAFSIAALSLFFAALAMQYGKLHEHAANKFAIARMDNPEGAIQGAKRAIHKWSSHESQLYLLYKRIFYRWESTMYRRQIEYANREIKERKSN